MLNSGDRELHLESIWFELILFSKFLLTDLLVALYYLVKLLSLPYPSAASLLYSFELVSIPLVAPQNTSLALPAFLVMEFILIRDYRESKLFSCLFDLAARVFFKFRSLVKRAASAILYCIFLSYYLPAGLSSLS